MTSAPRITVITIVRNAEKTLKKAINSVLTQAYSNLEYIIIDGGSTDETVNIIKSYCSHLSYWHSKPDRGGNDAYNIGLQHATGDIVSFLNADDWYEDNILQSVAQSFIQNQQPDVITCYTKIVKKTKEGKFKTFKNFNNAKQLELTLSNILFATPLINARFFKRSLFSKIGVFKPLDKEGNYLISADRELLIRAYQASVSQIILDKLGYVYLAHADSQTMSTNKDTLIKVLKEHLQICKHHLSQDFLSHQDKQMMNRWKNDQTRRLISAYIKSYQFKNAFKRLVTALLLRCNTSK